MSGIKPTRLWHLTSQKQFNKLIKDRESLGHPHNQRDKKDVPKLLVIVFGSALAFMYTYGALGFPTTAATVETNSGTANDTTEANTNNNTEGGATDENGGPGKSDESGTNGNKGNSALLDDRKPPFDHCHPER